MGNYDYRNQPIYPSGPNTLGWYYRIDGVVGQEDYTGRNSQRMAIPYTRPEIRTESNATAFKTPRQLSGRALVSDSFTKGGVTTEPGFGFFVHRDGYNVLYGDYNVRWYGDTEQRYIWWTTGSSIPNYEAANGFFYGLGDSQHYLGPQGGHFGVSNTGPGQADQYHIYAQARRLLTPLAWHLMDNFAQIDLDVEYDWYGRTTWGN